QPRRRPIRAVQLMSTNVPPTCWNRCLVRYMFKVVSMPCDPRWYECSHGTLLPQSTAPMWLPR
ncbi:MAG: hypothetical protein ACK56I_17825, partial [bacterium]